MPASVAKNGSVPSKKAGKDSSSDSDESSEDDSSFVSHDKVFFNIELSIIFGLVIH